jgi:Ca2+-transporting ATPase
MPEQKLRIVRALKAAGEVVAMTGDGVNDAPSLKAAHIGISMGKRGTDVAREASAIVLLDDDFSSIVTAMRMGRRIYDNLRKASAFIFAVHVPIGGLALAPLLLGWPLILGPVHIALLEMVIDPICALVYEAEPEEPDVMRRQPRHPDSPLVSRSLMGWSGVQGSVGLGALLALAWWADSSGLTEPVFRATCFAGLIATVLVLVFANRHFRTAPPSWGGKHNWPLVIILGILAGIFSAVFLVQPVAEILRFAILDNAEIQAVLAMAVALTLALFLAKRRFRMALAR